VLLLVALGVGGWLLRSRTPPKAGPVTPPVTQASDTEKPPQGTATSGGTVGGTSTLVPVPPVDTKDAGAGEEEKPEAGVSTPPASPADAGSEDPGEKPGPRSPKRTGFLTVDAVPWALITVEGKPAGQTPRARLTVPAGNVDIEFRNPETGKTARRRVRVLPGKESFVKVDLR
jgi:hypothetical protein